MQTYTGMEWLEIMVATHYGKKRLPFGARRDWTRKRKFTRSTLEAAMKDAKDPFQFKAAFLALERARRGEPIGYLAGVDAPASGPQIMSVLTRCEKGTRHTNATGKDIHDPYEIVLEKMAEEGKMAVDVTRDDVKGGLMPMTYGSVAEPLKRFGTGSLLRLFLAASWDVVPGAMQLMEFVPTLWRADVLFYRVVWPDGFTGVFKVKGLFEQRVRMEILASCGMNEKSFQYVFGANEPEEKGRFLLAHLIHGTDAYIVRELVSRRNHDRTEIEMALRHLEERLSKDGNTDEENPVHRLVTKTRMVSASGLERIAKNPVLAENLPEDTAEKLHALGKNVLETPPFPVVTIHDEFKSHPNHVDKLRATYRELLAEIDRGRLLESMLEDIHGDRVAITPRPSLADDIMKGEYALH